MSRQAAALRAQQAEAAKLDALIAASLWTWGVRIHGIERRFSRIRPAAQPAPVQPDQPGCLP